MEPSLSFYTQERLLNDITEISNLNPVYGLGFYVKFNKKKKEQEEKMIPFLALHRFEVVGDGELCARRRTHVFQGKADAKFGQHHALLRNVEHTLLMGGGKIEKKCEMWGTWYWVE